MKKNLILSMIFTALTFCGCASTTQGGAIGANRSQFMVVSEAQMNQSAVAAYNETLSAASQKKILNTNKAQTQRVNKISRNIINQVGVFRPDAAKWAWQVNVIDSKEVNAWCMPGGKIAVYTGIIDSLKLSDDELAAVIGHEIAHALREHSRERASSDMAKNVGLQVVSSVAGLGQLGSTVLNMAAQYTFSLPFSRKHETEADLMGAELMARAGYNPNAAISVWKKMKSLNKNEPAQFASTHPSNDTRIADLQKIMPRVEPLYAQRKR